jgi:hypothetical protein
VTSANQVCTEGTCAFLEQDAGAVDAGVDAGSLDGGDPCLDANASHAGCGTLSWMTSSVRSRPRNHHLTFLGSSDAGTFLYVIGGVNGTVIATHVDRIPIAGDGSLGPSVVDTSIPVAAGGNAGGLVSKAIVLTGGMTNGGVSAASYSSVIGDNGALAPWKTGPVMPHGRMHAGAFVAGDNLYVLGGFNHPLVWDDVSRAIVQADGTISAWIPAGTLPGPRTHFAVTLVDGYVFITGGLNLSPYGDPPLLSEVSRGRLAADGTVGEWTSMPALPVGLCTHSSFYYGGFLYVGGGISGMIQEKRFWRAPLGADHVLGAWEPAADLPVARGHVHQLPMYGKHIYSVSGAIDFDLHSTEDIEIGTFQ